MIPQHERLLSWRKREAAGLQRHSNFPVIPRFRGRLEMVAKGARYMVVGQLGEGKVTIQPSMITKKNLKVFGSFSGDISHYWKALQFIAKHQRDLPFSKLISNEYSLKDVNVALKRMQSFQEIKPVLYPWK